MGCTRVTQEYLTTWKCDPCDRSCKCQGRPEVPTGFRSSKTTLVPYLRPLVRSTTRLCDCVTSPVDLTPPTVGPLTGTGPGRGDSRSVPPLLYTVGTCTIDLRDKRFPECSVRHKFPSSSSTLKKNSTSQDYVTKSRNEIFTCLPFHWFRCPENEDLILFNT